MKQEPVVVERFFHSPVARVWQAITWEEDLKQWYFDLDGFRPEIGFEFWFNGGNEGRTYRHHCIITEVEQERKMSYSWQYEGYPGISYVHFELFPERGGTRLKLSHEGLESFPQDIQDFARKNFETGWTEIVNRLLGNYLEKQAASEKS